MMQALGARRLVFALAAAALTVAACSKRDNAYSSDTAAGSVALPSDTTAMPPAGGAMDLPTTEVGVIDFLKTVDNAEVELGQLGKTKASNAQVKSYAQMIVTDHSASLKRVNQLKVSDSSAAAETSSIVTTLQSKHQQTMSRLEGLSGAEFDRAFMEEMVSGHQQVLDIVRQLQSRVPSAQWSTTDSVNAMPLQKVIDAKVTSVEKHLDRGRTVQNNLGTGTSTDTTKQ